MFSGELIDQNNNVLGSGIIYCTEQFSSITGVCWLEYNVDDVNGAGPGTIVAYGSLPSHLGAEARAPGSPTPFMFTVTGTRGSFLTLSKFGGWIETFLVVPEGDPNKSMFFSTITLAGFRNNVAS